MEQEAIKETIKLFSNAVHTNQAMLKVLLQLEIDRTVRETGKSEEEVSARVSALLIRAIDQAVSTINDSANNLPK